MEELTDEQDSKCFSVHPRVARPDSQSQGQVRPDGEISIRPHAEPRKVNRGSSDECADCARSRRFGIGNHPKLCQACARLRRFG
eukprot:5478948-Pyramimonas_sp.AAC.1